ncbi:MAG: SulP family inorganic anion transporter [Candidatus Sericytochromatia bacterium]|nr:SulP family inorganic anion transporter [Candidatus Sericytochromatia bacterium]
MINTYDLRVQAETSLFARLRFYLNPFDARYEDLTRGSLWLNLTRDMAAGLVVAMVAIPLAMGFAMASGLRPEQGIVGGAIAGAVGALFGGSKYQVYGPTAAFIPLIAAIMAKHGQGFLVLASLLAGLVLIVMGLARAGRIVSRVPHSIVVGFTIGIAFVIAGSSLGDMMGLNAKLPIELVGKLEVIWQHRHDINWYAALLAIATFAVTKVALRISPFIPAPLIALGVGTWIAETAWAEKGLVNIKEKYASIPTDFWVFAAPAPIQWNLPFLTDLVFFVAAIVFVSGVESLLCSRMADRLAGNDRTPFHPNKELWGQGWVQVIVPLLNGFPHTGALARTAANIRLGAISPLAGIFKAVFKLLLAAFLASHLEMVPMACIGGILLYVAVGMVKWQEVEEVLAHQRFHVFLMAWTAVAVAATDFLKGVLSALVLWLVLRRWLEHQPPASSEAQAA